MFLSEGLHYSLLLVKEHQTNFPTASELISLSMRFSVTFLFFLVILLGDFYSGFAQKIDSLKALLNEKELSFTRELELLEALYQETPAEDSLAGAYLRRILELSRKEKDLSKFARWTITFFHSEAPGTLSNQEKINFLQEAAEIEPQLTDSRLKGNIYLKLGGAFYNSLDFDSAIYYYEQSIRRFGAEDSGYVADAHFFIGQSYDYQGDLIQAMKSYQQARDLYESLDDQEYVNYVLGGVSILYSRYGIYDEAEKIRERLIADYIDQKKTTDAAIQLYNRAEDLRKQNKTDLQFKALQRIEGMMPLEPENNYFEAIFYLSMANYFGRSGDIPSQLEYFKKAQAIIPKVSALQGRSPSLIYAEALIKKNQNDLKAANNLALEYVNLVATSKDLDHQIRGMELLADTYAALGNQKEATRTWQRLYQFKDSVDAVNQSVSFTYYQTLYETEKKERELLNKSREIEEINLKSEAKTRMFLFLIGGLVVIGVGGFLGKSLNQAKKEKKLQEKYSHELLKNQEEERKRISKDLHDGLGQSLLLIKNKVILNRDDNTGQLLDTAISELRAIARSLHPMQLEKLGLSKAIEQLLDQIDRETTLFVSSEVDEVSGKLDKEKELHLYRILQECLNNILKHAQASAIKVSLEVDEAFVQLRIEDNGKGFDFSEKFQDFQSLGLKTLKERTAAIQGVMKVSSEKGKGSQFTFKIFN